MLYDYYVVDTKNQQVPLKNFEGKVILIVNTATGCGFTPQYEQLEKMYEQYHDQGFEIIDIPCNQFGGQAPGTDQEIHQFCTLNYNTKFLRMKKSDVNGANALPLYKFLTTSQKFNGFDKDNKLTSVLEQMLAKEDPDFAKKSDIKWNFTKFVADRKGNVIARFEPTADMSKVEACVKSLL